ncbi:ABC transporter ATP-binding protein [Roseospira marina]|uniref:ABC transporter ATP-binding protein n=1 Tax=Roseospira marina TaxID=140057 RepID=A0A5M6IAX0_9PROT|nr:ABC transporter ATP-binding protein [Roseospira marina]KAA5604879.1 ABC transporter ATP-binding protein [Roseospira marina]MBB4315216.1 putative hydroxymethylpyrimidine transport system ATP-binding protein [Roseospira marina]MBB5088216.1 putative hydroxymethylpyrimidine transport system ATP-binding protein [Roseospira marina]
MRLSEATLSYDGVRLFADLALELRAGRTTALLGPSGVGKSTLLRLIAGLEVGDHVRATVVCDDGGPLAGRVAYLAQRDSLLPWASALDNVALGARLRGEPLRPARKRAASMLADVGLGDRLHDRPGRLSGGMRQRVALARALMEDRPVILMDEPFSALDFLTRLRLQDLTARLLTGRTVLLVTHDPLEALRLGDAIHVLHGRPANLDAPLEPPGAPPRAADDPALLARQADLVRRLTGEHHAGAGS